MLIDVDYSNQKIPWNPRWRFMKAFCNCSVSCRTVKTLLRHSPIYPVMRFASKKTCAVSNAAGASIVLIGKRFCSFTDEYRTTIAKCLELIPESATNVFCKPKRGPAHSEGTAILFRSSAPALGELRTPNSRWQSSQVRTLPLES